MKLVKGASRETKEGFQRAHDRLEDDIGPLDERLDDGGHVLVDGGRVRLLGNLGVDESIVLWGEKESVPFDMAAE